MVLYVFEIVFIVVMLYLIVMKVLIPAFMKPTASVEEQDPTEKSVKEALRELQELSSQTEEIERLHPPTGIVDSGNIVPFRSTSQMEKE